MSRLILIRVVLVLASLACLAVRSAHVSAAVTYQAAGNAVSGVTSAVKAPWSGRRGGRCVEVAAVMGNAPVC